MRARQGPRVRAGGAGLDEIAIEPTVLVFVVGLSVAVGVVFGLLRYFGTNCE